MKARKIIQTSRHKSRYRNLAGCAAVLIGFYEPVLWLLNLAFGIWPRCGTKIAEAGKTTKITAHSAFFFSLQSRTMARIIMGGIRQTDRLSGGQ